MAEQSSILCPACHRQNPARAKFCQYCGRGMVLHPAGPDRYRITRVIKAGGMGAVYEAIDDAGRLYALKELLDRFADPQERAEGIGNFQNEASLLKQLGHPCIPRVYNNFNDSERFYLVMDFVEGEDLEQLLEREGAQPEARVRAWADQLCDVLAYLHRNDLIYRDMKPSNIMVDRRSGGIKLVDFGITKMFHPTQRGTLLGTPGYSPPEQYQGLATPASDIYALGATLHHLLSGRDPRPPVPPFSFPPLRTLKPRISARTETAIQQALAMQAPDRFGSMEEFRQALLSTRPAAVPAQPRYDTVIARPSDNTTVLAGSPPAHSAERVPPAASTRRPSTPRNRDRVPRLQWLRRLLQRLVLLTLTIIILGAAGLYVWAPEIVNQYAPWLPPVEQLLPLVSNAGDRILDSLQTEGLTFVPD